MPEQQFKRNIAYKYRIGELLLGKPIFDQDRFSFLELGDKKIIRVNVIGNIVEKFESQKETKYMFLTIDDGSGQIRLKIFGDDVQKYNLLLQGQTIVVIGFLRSWGDEVYITPEIIKEMDQRYLLIRKLEIEKERAKNASPIGKKEIFALKDKVLEEIKKSENFGGIDQEKINLIFQNVSPDIIKQEIQKLLEEGIIFEPRPGKLRYLG
jgi:RPA family protein